MNTLEGTIFILCMSKKLENSRRTIRTHAQWETLWLSLSRSLSPPNPPGAHVWQRLLAEAPTDALFLSAPLIPPLPAPRSSGTGHYESSITTFSSPPTVLPSHPWASPLPSSSLRPSAAKEEGDWEHYWQKCSPPWQFYSNNAFMEKVVIELSLICQAAFNSEHSNPSKYYLCIYWFS